MEKFTQLTSVALPLDMDNLDTDQLMPKQFLHGIDKSGLDKGLFYNLRFTSDGEKNPACVFNKPGFEAAQIIVAGPNFGCGSSREHAPLAIKSCGVKCVIAPSFARIFYRNSINIGLPIVECPQAAEEIQAGDQVEVDFSTGVITDVTTGKTYQAAPFPEFIDNIIQSGGLLNSLKARGVAK